jgi:phosphoribosylaminoimidazolecarboxamide formyltransferase/IMP cyclohydrolase
MAKDGQVIGVAAGQQSRVDAVKLAGRKARIWWLRRHPKALELYQHFKPEVKRQQKINALIDYVEGEMTEIQRTHWESLFTTVPAPLTDEEKRDWLSQLTGVSLASDAFFPFRDNIDHASRYGVTQIIQPGGSTNDPEVIEACNQYGMVMVMTGARMFTH